MKTSILIESLFKKMRFHAVALIVLLTFTLFILVQNIGTIQYVLYNYRIVKNAAEDLYYTEAFISEEDIKHLALGEPTKLSRAIKDLEKKQFVEHIYCVYTVNPVYYNGLAFSITLIDPQIVTAFPSLVDIGLDFGDNEEGCVVAGAYFDSITDSIELGFINPENHTEEFRVIKHIRSVYKKLSLNNASTMPLAQDLFSDVDADIVFLATDNNLNHFKNVAKVEPSTNYLIVIKEDPSGINVTRVIDSLSGIGNVISLKEIAANSRAEIIQMLKTLLPRPLFLIFASTVSYLSMVLLFVRRKERELAISRLCGASIKQTTFLALIVTMIISFIPTLINALVVVLFDKARFSNITYLENLLSVGFDSVILGTPALMTIAVFFILMVCVALLAVRYSAAHKSLIDRLYNVE